MNTPIKWNASASGLVAAVSRPKWVEVRRGLRRILLGHLCLLLVAVPGLGLAWLSEARQGEQLLARLLPEVSAADAGLVGLVLGGAGAVLGGVLLLAGHWLCLGHALAQFPPSWLDIPRAVQINPCDRPQEQRPSYCGAQ